MACLFTTTELYRNTYGCPVIIGGDLSVHVEDPADDATTLLDLLTTFNLIQHVTAPTHRQGCMLNLFITYSDCPVSDVRVDPADVISDHSLVTGRISTDRCPVPTTTRRSGRPSRRHI